MAKDKLTDYDSTAANNLDVGGISVAEGMLPSGVNNAIRELMSHQADAFGAGTPLYVDQTNNRLGVGTASPEAKLHVSAGNVIAPFASTYILSENAGNNYMQLASGSTSLGAFYFADSADGDVGGLLYNHSNDQMTIRTGGSGRVFIASNGNTGLGTSSPSKTLHVSTGAYSYPARIESTGGSVVGLEFTNTGSGANPPVVGSKSDDIFFETNNAERMRIDSSGHLLVDCTSLPSSSVQGFGVEGQTIYSSAISTGTRNHHLFFNGNGQVGSIQTSGSSTAYNTSSDYRLKENVVADWDATTRLKQLNPVRFNFIADPDTTVDGFLAHEVQDIVPEAISGTKDAMRDEEYEVTPAVLDEDGNEVTPAVMGTRSVPEYQGIDQSKLVPLLVKTIQELEARITALETA